VLNYQFINNGDIPKKAEFPRESQSKVISDETDGILLLLHGKERKAPARQTRRLHLCHAAPLLLLSAAGDFSLRFILRSSLWKEQLLTIIF
jgi:hypothetical protein